MSLFSCLFPQSPLLLLPYPIQICSRLLHYPLHNCWVQTATRRASDARLVWGLPDQEEEEEEEGGRATLSMCVHACGVCACVRVCVCRNGVTQPDTKGGGMAGSERGG